MLATGSIATVIVPRSTARVSLGETCTGKAYRSVLVRACGKTPDKGTVVLWLLGHHVYSESHGHGIAQIWRGKAALVHILFPLGRDLLSIYVAIFRAVESGAQRNCEWLPIL